jgi:hypothetical protein
VKPDRPDGIGLISFLHHRWTDRWATSHNILSRLAERWPIVAVEQTVYWRSRKPRAPVRRVDGVTVLPGPLLIPRALPLQNWLLRRTLRRARSIVEAQGANRIGLYLWHFELPSILDWSGADALFYHVSDEYTFSDVELPIPPEELRILETADHVFLHSSELFERKAGLTRSASLLPNGVDFEAVTRAEAEPDDMAEIPRPRIGYTGWLKKQLDWLLIEALAKRRPGYHFVFVGGRSPHPTIQPFLERLSRRDNCHFLGEKPTEELYRYPAHFDVCIMPYEINDYTRYIYPLKLHEYLASGHPLISAPVPAVREHADVVTIADGPDEWTAALDREIEDPSKELADKRRERAREHDWSHLTERAARTIREQWPEAEP